MIGECEKVGGESGRRRRRRRGLDGGDWIGVSGSDW